jgi:hypothetical protein
MGERRGKDGHRQVECRPDHFNTPKYVLSASAVARDIVRFPQRNSGTDADADPLADIHYDLLHRPPDPLVFRFPPRLRS